MRDEHNEMIEDWIANVICIDTTPREDIGDELSWASKRQIVTKCFIYIIDIHNWSCPIISLSSFRFKNVLYIIMY
jgi:hypothetical protein